MHVNRYVPFFQQFAPLSKGCLHEFGQTYDEHQDLKHYLIDFDKKLIEIFNHRRERYIRKFYPQFAPRKSSRSPARSSVKHDGASPMKEHNASPTKTGDNDSVVVTQ